MRDNKNNNRKTVKEKSRQIIDFKNKDLKQPKRLSSKAYGNTQLDTSRRYRHQMSADILSESEETELIRYNHLTYLLYAISFFTAGLLWVVPIIMNYLYRSKADNTWLATHFDWQIKTFWYSIIIWVVGLVIAFLSLGGLGVGVSTEKLGVALGSSVGVLFGGLIITFAVLWHLYRIVKGWIALTDKRPV